MIKQAEQVFSAKSQSLASSDGKAGIILKPGSYSGVLYPVEWKFGRVLSVTCGTAKLEH